MQSTNISSQKGNWIFYGIAILSFIPILVTKYFPSVDGPSHLEIANILHNFLFNGGEDFNYYFQVNKNFVNTVWLFYLLPSLIIKLVPISFLEKLIIVSYISFFIFTINYSVNISVSKTRITAFLLLPLIYNFALHKGFYSFLFSFTLSILVISYYLNYENRFTSSKFLIFAFLSNLIYFLHPVPFVMTYVILATYSGSVLILEFLKDQKLEKALRHKLLNHAWKKLGFLLCGLPGFILIVLTLFQEKEGGSDAGLNLTSLIGLIKTLFGFHFLWSYDSFEILMGRILLLLVLILFICIVLKKIRESSIDKSDCLLVALLSCLIIYFLAPENLAGGGSVNLRVSAYIYILIVFWIGTKPIDKILRKIVKFTSIFVIVALLIFHTIKSIQIGTLLEEFVSASPYVREKSTIVSFSFIDKDLNLENKKLSNRLGIEHTAGYIACLRNGINLNNFQSTRKNFPIQFHPEVNPREWLFTKKSRFNGPLILDYNEQTPGQIDYVLLWGVSESKDNSSLNQIKQQMTDGYRLVYTSPNQGLVELYEIKLGSIGIPRKYLEKSD